MIDYKEKAEALTKRICMALLCCSPDEHSASAWVTEWIAAALADRDAEIVRLKDGYQLDQFSSKGCPGCEYNEGVFIKYCVIHAELAQLRAKVECLTISLDATEQGKVELLYSREIAELRAKLAEADADRINIEKVAGERWTKLKADRDAAYVRGLKRAQEICVEVVNDFKNNKLRIEKWTAHEAAELLAAEIDKVGK